MRTLAAALLALLPAVALAQNRRCTDTPLPPLVEGRAFAVDGDTIAFTGRPRVRLWGIQAPELRDKKTGQETPAGMAARAAMADMLGRTLDTPVRCRPVKWDRYCRLVATCAAATGESDAGPLYEDLGTGMLVDGMAYTFMLDDPLHGREAEGETLAANYARLEAGARQRKTGLWKNWLP